MATETLLHLNYLNRVYILVNMENRRDYSLHLKAGNTIDMRTYKEIDGNEKERLAAYLIAVERYHLWQESIDTGRSAKEIRTEDSYLQLVNFIDDISPGYAHRWAYLKEANIVKEKNCWKATYEGVELIYNQLENPKIVFHLIHRFEPSTKEIHQSIEWVIPESELMLNNEQMKDALRKIKEDGILYFKQAINPALPDMFEGFEELLDD